MATIDVKRLAAEISVQHGIRIDPDDPIMAVVTLNQLIFEQSISEVLHRVECAALNFEQAADKIQARTGVILAKELRDCVVSLRREMLKNVEADGLPPQGAAAVAGGGVLAMASVRNWIAVGLVSAAGLFSAGVWVGACLR